MDQVELKEFSPNEQNWRQHREAYEEDEDGPRAGVQCQTAWHGAGQRGPAGLAHDECKVGTMKMDRFNGLMFGMSCVRVQHS